MAGRSLRSSWYRKMLCRWHSSSSANSSPGSLVFLQVAIIFVGFTLASSPGGGLTNWRRNSKPKPRLQPVKTTTRLSIIDIELLCFQIFQILSAWEEAGSVVVNLARFKGRKSGWKGCCLQLLQFDCLYFFDLVQGLVICAWPDVARTLAFPEHRRFVEIDNMTSSQNVVFFMSSQ